MPAYTVIVADQRNATIYDLAAPAAPLCILDRLVNPAGHRHERGSGSRAPRRPKGWNGLRHALMPRPADRQHATESFLRAVIAAADRPVPGQQRYEVLLITAPALQGVFRRLVPRSWNVTVLPGMLVKSPPGELGLAIAECMISPPARPRRGWFGAA
ncbi:MAG TPA: host attachment protein [Steroidobacteraceae bacterium]|nr:host attachment protein [Steroidobacteraceae bacterium]